MSALTDVLHQMRRAIYRPADVDGAELAQNIDDLDAAPEPAAEEAPAPEEAEAAPEPPAEPSPVDDASQPEPVPPVDG